MVEPGYLLRPHRNPRHRTRRAADARSLRRFEVIEITGEATWMSAGSAATVSVAVQSLPLRLA